MPGQPKSPILGSSEANPSLRCPQPSVPSPILIPTCQWMKIDIQRVFQGISCLWCSVQEGNHNQHLLEASAAARRMQLYLNKILIQGIMLFASNQQLAVATLQPECNHNNGAYRGKAFIRRYLIIQTPCLPSSRFGASCCCKMKHHPKTQQAQGLEGLGLAKLPVPPCSSSALRTKPLRAASTPPPQPAHLLNHLFLGSKRKHLMNRRC